MTKHLAGWYGEEGPRRKGMDKETHRPGHYFLSLGPIMASLAHNVGMAILSRIEQSGLVRALLGREADDWSLAMPRPIFQHPPHLKSFSLLNHFPSLPQPRNGSNSVAAEGKAKYANLMSPPELDHFPQPTSVIREGAGP